MQFASPFDALQQRRSNSGCLKHITSFSSSLVQQLITSATRRLRNELIRIPYYQPDTPKRARPYSRSQIPAIYCRVYWQRSTVMQKLRAQAGQAGRAYGPANKGKPIAAEEILARLQQSATMTGNKDLDNKLHRESFIAASSDWGLPEHFQASLLNWYWWGQAHGRKRMGLAGWSERVATKDKYLRSSWNHQAYRLWAETLYEAGVAWGLQQPKFRPSSARAVQRASSPASSTVKAASIRFAHSAQSADAFSSTSAARPIGSALGKQQQAAQKPHIQAVVVASTSATVHVEELSRSTSSCPPHQRQQWDSSLAQFLASRGLNRRCMLTMMAFRLSGSGLRRSRYHQRRTIKVTGAVSRPIACLLRR